MDKENNSSQDIKNALAFVPILNFVWWFIDKDKTERFERNLKYSMIMFWVFVPVSLLFRFIFFWLIFVIYVGVIVYFGFRAYEGNDVRISFLDAFLDGKEKEEKKDDHTTEL